MRRYLIPHRGRNWIDPFTLMDNAMRTAFHGFGEPLSDEDDRLHSPSMDVFRKDGVVTLVVDLPGVSKEDIDLKVYRNQIEIRAERHSESQCNEGDCLHSERAYGSISRTVSLPAEIDCDSVQAGYTDGVLRVEAREIRSGGEGRTVAIGDGV